MPSEKFKIVSLSMKPEMETSLKSSSKELKCSVSQLVRDLVDQYLYGNKKCVFEINSETEIKLRAGAEQNGCSVAELVQTLIDKHLNLLVKSDEYRMVKFAVPSDLTKDVEKLRAFLNSKSEEIIKVLQK